MKKIVSVLTSLMFVLFVFSACEKEAEESCEADEFCQANSETFVVTACCIEGKACVYKYNDKEYADTEEGIKELSDVLGCVKKKGGDQDAAFYEFAFQLQQLKEKALSGL